VCQVYFASGFSLTATVHCAYRWGFSGGSHSGHTQAADRRECGYFRVVFAGFAPALLHGALLPAKAKRRFRLPADAPVRSCYEAGRDGFWLHRHLTANGVDNGVVDSASIEVNRRQRRAKTDRLDAGKLLNLLLRYHGGERKVWSIVPVPSVADEDAR